MKKIICMLAISIIALTLAASGAYAGDMTKGSKLIGTSVENNQGEKLGRISDLVYDETDNSLAFVILSLGGVPGAGDKLVPVPITALTFKDENAAVINISKEKLATAPSFEKNKVPHMANRQWADETYRYFGVSPKWEHKGMEREMKEEMKKEGEKEKGKYGY